MDEPTAQSFRPAPGLGNPHVQTIAGKLLRPEPPVATVRERVRTPDGDFLDLDFIARPGGSFDAGSGPAVLVLHGLEGAASRRYMKTTYVALMERGLRPVGLNFRGCSGEPNILPRAYHSGETGDLRFVAEMLADRVGGPLGVIGFSLGGNVTLKYLGEEGGGGPVAAAAAVSVPFDLGAGADRISSGIMGRVYSTYFIRSLRRKIRLKADLMRDVCDVAAVDRVRTIREFDNLVTAPIHGYDHADHYYDEASSNQFIAAIRTPTLVLHSKDDPFLPEDRIPVEAMRGNPRVTALLTERGGHVGFVGGSLSTPHFWAEQTLADWLAPRLHSSR